MSQAQTTTIKMMYHGKLEYITRPLDTEFENFLGIAIERFAIPTEFKDSLQISNDSRQGFTKDTFEYFTQLFPNPEIIFYIRVDYRALLGDLRTTKTRKAISKINKPKVSDEDEIYVPVPVTKQNCFIGSFPGFDPSELEEPQAKIPKTNDKQMRVVSKATGIRKVSSRKSIRF